MWTNNYINCIFYDKLTDHYPILSTFSDLTNKTNNNDISNEKIKFRHYNSINTENFKRELSEVD